MKFRIITDEIKYYSQRCEEAWNGTQWFDKWTTIGDQDGYDTIEQAESACRAYKLNKDPEVVKEFEL